jgi:pimeloyl-ACP methyl ester carboxylesterase
MSPEALPPFAIDVPDAVLEDLDWRLRRARWPDELLLAGGEDAARLEHVRRLLERWRSSFDWRAYERRLNALPQHRVVIDGIGLHLVWARSERPGARPLLLLNGWPSTFVEFEPVVARLTAPTEGPAFDVVIPTRPGYGFSDRALDRAGDDDAVADLFVALMREHLGYDAFLVHGDDFGGSIASRIAWRHAAAVAALHVAEWLEPDCDVAAATAAERRYLDALADWRGRERAYGAIAATRPQTLGLALDDSPLGLLAWIADKFLSWTDARADGELPVPADLVLATATLYWATQTMATSMRPYAEDGASLGAGERISVPAAVVAPRESRPAPPRSWIERTYADLRAYTVRARGGHFLAAEDPDAFVAELRAFYGGLDRDAAD